MMQDFDVTAKLILPDDVAIIPVIELPQALRKRVTLDGLGFYIHRSNARATTKIIDEQAKQLLELFRSPKTIVECASEFSVSMQQPAEVLLDGIYDLVDSMVAANFLMSADHPGATRIRATYHAGAVVSGWHIRQAIQVLEDTEVYRVSNDDGVDGALKINRTAAVGTDASETIRREAAVLRLLNGVAAPSLVDSGTHDACDYLVTSWCEGSEADLVAAELRSLEWPAARRELKQLTIDVLEAYIAIHRQGVVHGDVHHRNLLLSRRVSIIDFGFAQLTGPRPVGYVEPGRAGMLYFAEPEYARAIRARQTPPRASVAGEQYSLAALLYYLISGAHYIDFTLLKATMLEEICQRPPDPFAASGVGPWPDMEAALAVALAKDPRQRFQSLQALRDRMAAVRVVTPHRRSCSTRGGLTSLSNAVVDALTAGPRDRQGRPRLSLASLNNGAAGAAYALYRIACVGDRPHLLDLSDAWLAVAFSMADRPDGIYSRALNLSTQTVGRVSPYHTLSGLHCIDALVGHAFGDTARVRRAVLQFMESARPHAAGRDLTLGVSGLLLASALLWEATAPVLAPDDVGLKSFGNQMLARVWSEDFNQEIVDFTGMAHGWAGLLYATLRWHIASGQPIPPTIEPRLDWLASLGEPVGDGLRWRWQLSQREDRYMTGWCGGSAGMIFLWTLADRVDCRYRELAERAARYCLDTGSSVGDLCCGCTGIAYGFLNLFRQTGNSAWLQRSIAFGRRAAKLLEASAASPYSLFQGSLGAATFATDVAHPERAAMPFFEAEGWPGVANGDG